MHPICMIMYSFYYSSVISIMSCFLSYFNSPLHFYLSPNLSFFLPFYLLHFISSSFLPPAFFLSSFLPRLPPSLLSLFLPSFFASLLPYFLASFFAFSLPPFLLCFFPSLLSCFLLCLLPFLLPFFFYSFLSSFASFLLTLSLFNHADNIADS